MPGQPRRIDRYDSPRLGNRVPWLRVSLIAAVLAVGIGAATYTWREETERVDMAEEAAADRAGALLTAIGTTIDASLAGSAAVIGPDGELDEDAFRAFGLDLTASGGITALGYERVTADADRADFEARIGQPITDRPGSETVVAPQRALYYAVEAVVGGTEATQQLIGFDILGDPPRAAAAEAARDLGTVVFSEPVPSEPSGALSVFLVKPVYRFGSVTDTADARRAALVGFVSSAFPSENLADAMTFVLPEGADFAVLDGDDVLASEGGSVEDGVSRTVEAAGRQWTVIVADTSEPDRGVAVLIVVVADLVALGMLVELRRSRRNEEEARRTEELARLAEGLTTRSSSEDVMRFLTTGVLAPLGAIHAAVAVIEGPRLRRYFTPGDRTVRAGDLLPEIVRLDADTPLANAARTGAPAFVPDIAALRDRYPAQIEAWIGLGFTATANLPLRDRNGQLIGALGVAWDHSVDFGRLRDLLTTVAGIAGQTIDRARLADAEHRLAITMQEGLLTPLPAVEGLDVAERYLPATEGVGMGGDWFEGIVGDAGRYLVVVGDVAGHGIGAVATMAQLRSKIGTIAALGTPLADVLPWASQQLIGDDVFLASAAVVEIDLEAQLVRYVCAGHPPPIVRMPDGTAVILEDGRLPLLGVAAEERAIGEHPFPPGAALVCFTDGLIERRTEPIDESIRRLAGVLATSTATTAEALADEVLERCLPDSQDDDVVVTVVVNRSVD